MGATIIKPIEEINREIKLKIINTFKFKNPLLELAGNSPGHFKKSPRKNKNENIHSVKYLILSKICYGIILAEVVGLVYLIGQL